MIAELINEKGEGGLDNVGHLPAPNALLGDVARQSSVVVKVVLAERGEHLMEITDDFSGTVLEIAS